MPRSPRFLPLFLLLYVSTVHGEIVPAAETQVTAPIVEPAAFGQGSARLATDTEGFLSVWTEQSTRTSDVHGARLHADGTRIDAEPLLIASTPGFEQYPDVAFGGGHYLVAWSQHDAILGRFVEPDGSMSDPFPVSGAPRQSSIFYPPRIAFNGRFFLVAWYAQVGPPRFAGALVAVDGSAIKTVDLGIAETYVEQIAVTAVGDTFYLANLKFEGDGRNLGITAISENGEVGTRQVISPVEDVAINPQAAADGDEAVVAWTAFSGTSERSIRYVRIDDSGPEPYESFPIGLDGELEAIVTDASGFLLIYGDTSSRFARRVGAAETVAIPTPNGSSRVSDGARGGSGTILIVEATEFDPVDLYVHRIYEADFEPLVTAQRHQSTPELAEAGSLRLAVWWEWQTAERRRAIVATRISAGGDVLDRAGMELAEMTGHVPARPRIASDGTRWLVVWVDAGIVKAVRVSRSGRLLDDAPLVIAINVHYSTDIEVAWDGTSYVVVFTIGTPTRFGAQMNIVARRVTAEGEVEAPYLALSPNASYFEPAIAGSPSRALVVWHDTRAGSIEGALLSPAGTIVPVAFPSTGGRAVFSVAAGWNGSTFLVAAAFQNDAIRWFFVSETGNVTPAPWTASLPFVAPRPGEYVAIEIQPAGDGFFMTCLNDGSIRALSINASGYIDGPPTVVARTGSFETSFGMSGSMIAYARPGDDVHERLTRVFVRSLQIRPDGPRRRALR